MEGNIQELVRQATSVSGEVFWSALVFLLTCGLIPTLIKMLDGPRFQAALSNVLENASWWQLYVKGVAALDERLDDFFGGKLVSGRSYRQTFRFSAVYTTIAFSSFTFMLIAPPDDTAHFAHSVALLDRVEKWIWVTVFLVASIILGAWLWLRGTSFIQSRRGAWTVASKAAFAAGWVVLVALVQYLAWQAFDNSWAQFVFDSDPPTDLAGHEEWRTAAWSFLRMFGISVAITSLFIVAGLAGIELFAATAIASLIGTAAFMATDPELAGNLNTAIDKSRIKGSFFFLALYATPFGNGVLDTLSVGVTRRYIKKLIDDFGVATYAARLTRIFRHIGIDVLIGFALLALGVLILPLTLIWSPLGELYTMSLGGLADGEGDDPMVHGGLTSVSLFLMISSTLVPTAAHIGMAVMAIALQPAPLRQRALSLCAAGQAGTSLEFAEKFGVALYIAFSIWLTVCTLILFYYAVILVFDGVFETGFLSLIMHALVGVENVYLDILGLDPIR